MSQKCSHLTRRGQPCQAWAVRGSSPPRCAAHGGRAQVAGKAQVASRSAPPEGSLDLNAVIYDLAEKHAQVSALIDRCLELPESASLDEVLRLMQHHAQTASRLGRLLRDQQALVGRVDERLLAAFNRTLDELSAEWGIDL